LVQSGNDQAYEEIRCWYKENKDQYISFYPSENDHTLNQKSVLQIILIRHGNPEINKNGWFSNKAARAYIKAYDTVGVNDIEKLPVKLKTHQNVAIYSSPLNRAYDTSQKVFGQDMKIEVDSSFIEFQREIIPLPLILPIKGWTSLSRFFWVIGLHSSDIPSFKSEKSRAEQNAEFLDKVARENKKVILVAHGFLNKYIVRYLKKNGWDHSYNGGNDYLAVHVMTQIVSQ
jgi:broad specificity phosphatase PhoE